MIVKTVTFEVTNGEDSQIMAGDKFIKSELQQDIENEFTQKLMRENSELKAEIKSLKEQLGN
tara:strand:- start:843 stop:1028 length:186 start_codon:yes stop_codon:yes gene_type:complete